MLKQRSESVSALFPQILNYRRPNGIDTLIDIMACAGGFWKELKFHRLKKNAAELHARERIRAFWLPLVLVFLRHRCTIARTLGTLGRRGATAFRPVGLAQRV